MQPPLLKPQKLCPRNGRKFIHPGCGAEVVTDPCQPIHTRAVPGAAWEVPSARPRGLLGLPRAHLSPSNNDLSGN